MTEAYEEHLSAAAQMLNKAGLDGSRAAELDAAVDILTDDGMSTERAYEMLIAVMRRGEMPLEQFARKVVRMRGAIREEKIHVED